MKKLKPETIIWTAIVLCVLPFIAYISKFWSHKFSAIPTNWGVLGDFIGGISNPLIALASATLLYMTLTKQIDSHTEQEKATAEQKTKNEVELVFTLINQLDTEMKNFFVLQSEWNPLDVTDLVPYRGIHGLFLYVENCVKFDQVTRDNKEFAKSTVGSQFLLFMDSFDIIVERIKYSSLDCQMKNRLLVKLHNTYCAKFKYPCTTISAILTKQNISLNSVDIMNRFHNRMMNL